MRKLMILAAVLAGIYTSASGTPTKRRLKYERLVVLYEKMFALPPGLLHAVVQHESGFNRTAINGPAIGLGQIHWRTAKQFCNMSRDMLYNPPSNLYCSAKILRHLLDTHGTTTIALSAYNAGSPCVCNGARYVRRGGSRLCASRGAKHALSCRQKGTFLNQAYVDRVLAIYAEQSPPKSKKIPT